MAKGARKAMQPAPTPSKSLQVVPEVDSELEAKAESFVQQLMSISLQDPNVRHSHKMSVETVGLELQREAAQRLQLLSEPVKRLSTRSEEGGEVANALLQLKSEVEELDPGKFDFEPGWITRVLGRLPGVGSPMKRYFSRFESSQTVIAAIIRSLEDGRDQLARDNITLSEDQRQMREMTVKLEKVVRLGQLIDNKLQSRLDRDLNHLSEEVQARHKFISEELLFPLRQRLIDLQQQLAVNQQGVLASEIVIRNNKELIQGVERSINVTVTALQVAATVAMALAHQKIVLDKIDSVSRTTSDLIAGTASRLRTQGIDIQKRATTAQLDMNSLKSAFGDLRHALDDLSRFRMEALPKMAAAVQELNQVTSEASRSIERMEAGNKSRIEKIPENLKNLIDLH